MNIMLYDDLPTPDIALPRVHGNLWAFAAILATYIVAFFVPALGNSGANNPMMGYDTFWMGLVYSFFVFPLLWTFPWFANLLFFFGLTALWFNDLRSACVHGILATGLAAFVIPLWGSNSLFLGYYLWIGSMAALAVSAWILELHSKFSRSNAAVAQVRPSLSDRDSCPASASCDRDWAETGQAVWRPR